jgi:hypothetical protein
MITHPVIQAGALNMLGCTSVYRAAAGLYHWPSLEISGTETLTITPMTETDPVGKRVWFIRSPSGMVWWSPRTFMDGNGTYPIERSKIIPSEVWEEYEKTGNDYIVDAFLLGYREFKEAQQP